MRKTLAVAVLGLLGMVFLAAPANAQRDPFQPRGGTGEGVVEPEGGAGPDETEPEAEPPPSEGGLGDTGTDPQPWLVVAYTLVVTGIGAVTLARVISAKAPPRSGSWRRADQIHTRG